MVQKCTLHLCTQRQETQVMVHIVRGPYVPLFTHHSTSWVAILDQNSTTNGTNDVLLVETKVVRSRGRNFLSSAIKDTGRLLLSPSLELSRL